MSEGDFLSRWSRRKIEARTATREADPPQEAKPAVPPTADGKAAAVAHGTPAAPAEPQPLPPVETLTFDSDFSAFMQPGVDAVLRRQALKTLMNDPRFNVMDGLDVYIDDYSKPDPLPEGWLEKLNQYASLGNHEPGYTEPAVRDVEAAPAVETVAETPVETPAEALPDSDEAPGDLAQHSDTADAVSPPAQGGESSP